MALANRLNDPEYKNWLKCGQALFLLVNGIRDFAEDTITSYHDDLTQQLGTLGICQQQCKPKKDPPNTCGVCHLWKKELMSKHATKQVFWSNVDPKSWPNEKWEVAKLYMARGQKPNDPITAQNLDSTHMLNMLKNCKEFHQHLSNKNLPNKVLQKRNKLMHSSNMKISNADFKDTFDVFVQFLEDKPKLSHLAKSQEAVKKINELKTSIFDIKVTLRGVAQAGSDMPPVKVLTEDEVKELEITLIRTMMEDYQTRFNARLEALENKQERPATDETEIQLSQDLRDLQTFVNDNKDLKAVFGNELEDLKSKYDELETRIQEIDVGMIEMSKGMAEMTIRLDAAESRPLPETEKPNLPETSEPDAFMVNAIKTTVPLLIGLLAIGVTLMYHQSHAHLYTNSGAPAANYVNLLQEISQKMKIGAPEYKTFTEPLGKIASVTVRGKTYRSAQPERTIKEARQAAAKTAYAILKEQENFNLKLHASGEEASNYVGKLNEYQQNLGLSKPSYISNKLPDSMLFTMKVNVELPDGNQVTFESQSPEKNIKDAKQLAAKFAYEKLLEKSKKPIDDRADTCSKPTASPSSKAKVTDINYKGKLQEHQQTSSLAIPTYIVTPDGKGFQAEVTVPLPDGKKEIFTTETVCASKKEAEHEVARKALESLVGDVVAPVLEKTPEKSTSVKADVGKGLQVDTAQDINYKGKLQEHQQTSSLAIPTYKATQDATGFQAEVSVPLPDGSKGIFTTEMVCASKKEAEQEAAKMALGILVGDVVAPVLETTPEKVTSVKADVGKGTTQQIDTAQDINYKGKLQEHQQTSGLAIPTYKATQDATGFQAEVTVPLPDGSKGIFTTEMVNTSKKEAEQGAARKALQSLVDGVVQTQGKISGKSSNGKADEGPSDYKSKLQITLAKSHGATIPPKYEDTVDPSQPGLIRSKVTFMSKHLLQGRPCASKKDAEKDAARSALKQLGVSEWQTISDPKGKMIQLYPKIKPVFKLEEIVDTKQFQCTLLFTALEELSEIVISADESAKSKKDSQRFAAKKVLQWLEELHLDRIAAYSPLVREGSEIAVKQGLGKQLGGRSYVIHGSSNNIILLTDNDCVHTSQFRVPKPKFLVESQSCHQSVPLLDQYKSSPENLKDSQCLGIPRNMSADSGYSGMSRHSSLNYLHEDDLSRNNDTITSESDVNINDRNLTSQLGRSYRYGKLSTEDIDGRKIKVSQSTRVDGFLHEIDFTLNIPSYAIRQNEDISLAISNGPEHLPLLQDDQYLIGPVLSCQPDGIKFLHPVTISVPHSFINLSPKYLQIWSKSESTEDHHDWEMIYDGIQDQTSIDGSSIMLIVERSKIKFRVTHFTLFSIVLAPINKLITWMYPKMELQLDIWAYLCPVNVTDKVLLRIYALKVTDIEGKHLVQTTELGQEGGRCAIPTTFIFSINKESLSVHFRYLHPRAKWVTGDGDMGTSISFRNILLGGLAARCEIQFEVAEDVDEYPNKFGGAFDLRQEGNEFDPTRIHFDDDIARRGLEKQHKDLQRKPQILPKQENQREIKNEEIKYKDVPISQQHQRLECRRAVDTRQKDDIHDDNPMRRQGDQNEVRQCDPLLTGARPKQKSVNPCLSHKIRQGQGSDSVSPTAQSLAISSGDRLVYQGDPSLPFGGTTSGLYCSKPEPNKAPFGSKDSNNSTLQQNTKQSQYTKLRSLCTNQTESSLTSMDALGQSYLTHGGSDSKQYTFCHGEPNIPSLKGDASAGSTDLQGAAFNPHNPSREAKGIEQQSGSQSPSCSTIKPICGDWTQVFRIIARKMEERDSDLPKYAKALNLTAEKYEEIERKHTSNAYFRAFYMLNRWLAIIGSSRRPIDVKKVLVEAIRSVDEELAGEVMKMY